MRIGYFLSSEERGPRELVEQAVNAQEAGFEGLWISDHYPPTPEHFEQDAFFEAYRERVLPRVRG